MVVAFERIHFDSTTFLSMVLHAKMDVVLVVTKGGRLFHILGRKGQQLAVASNSVTELKSWTYCNYFNR